MIKSKGLAGTLSKSATEHRMLSLYRPKLTSNSSLTQSFPLSDSPTQEDAATLKNQLSALSTIYETAKSDLLNRDAELRSVHARLSHLSESSTQIINDLTEKKREFEREARWAKEGRASAEKREAVARREADELTRATPVSVGPDGCLPQGIYDGMR
jgi:mitotic spindle assembly checkpoint protein MAD1